MNVTETRHGIYAIKAGKLAGVWVARAFLRPPAKAKGTIAEARGKSAEDAVEAVKGQLDGLEGVTRWEERAGFAVPSKNRYDIALAQAKLTKPQIAMLKAHAVAGEHGLTASELARAGGYSAYETANTVYGKAGRAIGDTLGVDAPEAVTRSGDVATGIIAWEGPARPDSAHFVWVMYPELRDAVREAF